MGEIRVKVMLTNAMDEILQRSEKLKKNSIRRYEADARVDFGAVRSIIPARVMHSLGVLPSGNHEVEYADGRKESVPMTSSILFEILGRDTHDEALILGDEVVIGYTVLNKLDLHANCANRRLIPNPAHPDRPVTKVK